MWNFDIETDGLLDTVSRFHIAVFIHHETGEQKVFLEKDTKEMFSFMDSVDVLVGHNINSYDLPVLKKLFGYEYKGRIIDTLILSKLLSPNRLPPPQDRKSGVHSVEAWGVRLGHPKVVHKDWSKYTPEMRHRCVEDVKIQIEIYDALMDEAKKLGGDWSKAIPMTMKLFQILQKIEEVGWKVDKELMRTYINDLSIMQFDLLEEAEGMLPWVIEDEGEVKKPFTKAGRLSAQIVKWYATRNLDVPPIAGPYCRVSFRRLDLNKRNEVVDLLLKEGWIPKEWNTNDAGEQTSPKLSKTEEFEGVEGNLGKIAAKFIQVRHRKSLLEGLMKLTVERGDGRISQRFTGIATTGRMKHAGIVNIPNAEAFFGKEIRSVFTVPDDKVLVGVDSDSCQNRMLAARVGDDNFTKIILEGSKEDESTIHYVNQRVMREAGYEVSYGMSKNLGYAFNFGASDGKLGKMVGGTKEDGTRIRKALLSVSAGLEDLLNSLEEEWKQTASKRKNRWGGYDYYNGTITGLDGRAIKIESSHALLVYLLQSDEAIMMSYALLFLYKWCEERGWKWGEDYSIVSWTHDEFQAEVCPEIQEEYSALAEKSIVYAGQYLKIQIEHIGDADVGRNWYETH